MQFNVNTGKFVYNSRTFQGLLKDLPQLFSRTIKFRKILTYTLKFYFKNARLR